MGQRNMYLHHLKKRLLLSTMASLPSKILLLSISSTPRSGHGNGEGDGEGDGDHGTDTTEKKKKKSNKGDCISIAKKIALIDEFNALRDGGCTKPNHEPHLFFFKYWLVFPSPICTNFKDSLQQISYLTFLSSISIRKVYQNIDRALQVEFGISLHASEEMLKRKRPGYYSGCCSRSKWPLSREKFKWDKFSELLPHQASKRDEVPSWLKTRLCEVGKFKGPKKETIPDELLQIADAILMDEVSRGLEMCRQSVSQLLISLIDLHNQEAEAFNKKTQKEHMEKACELEQSGELDEKELEAFLKEQPQQISLISKEWTDKKLEHIVYRFCRIWGYGLYRQDRPSKHLSREHPSMKSLHEYIQFVKAEKKALPRLMFNWDQVWTCTLERVLC